MFSFLLRPPVIFLKQERTTNKPKLSGSQQRLQAVTTKGKKYWKEKRATLKRIYLFFTDLLRTFSNMYE